LDIPNTLETVAEGLNVPWEMDIAKDGRIFFTERPGSLRKNTCLYKPNVVKQSYNFHSEINQFLLVIISRCAFTRIRKARSISSSARLSLSTETLRFEASSTSIAS
jgi:hypothetical protein